MPPSRESHRWLERPRMPNGSGIALRRFDGRRRSAPPRARRRARAGLARRARMRRMSPNRMSMENWRGNSGFGAPSQRGDCCVITMENPPRKRAHEPRLTRAARAHAGHPKFDRRPLRGPVGPRQRGVCFRARIRIPPRRSPRETRRRARGGGGGARATVSRDGHIRRAREISRR